MSKRTLIATLIIAVVVVGGLAWAAVGKNQGPISLLGPLGTTPKTEGAAEKEETYTDTAGFSFKHPESIVVSDKTPNDNAYYTLLSLSSKTKKDGPLTIAITDTNLKTLDEWLAEDSARGGATLSGATTLSGISAKQYSTSAKLWTVAIDSGILYLIEGLQDGGYWEDVHNLAVSTFALGKPQAAESVPSDSGAIYEEEEVIE